jgi:hypothetical protein
MPDNSWDVIYHSQVLEQIPDENPIIFFESVLSCLEAR